jgi:ribonucleoside-diphosphate reductase alpha chain
MQVATETVQPAPTAKFAAPETTAAAESLYAQYRVIRRNGAVVGFEPSKVGIAMTKAFIAVNGGQGAASARVREQVAKLTEGVVNALMRRQPSGGTFHIEDIQDQVELALMRSGEHDIARAYVLYREERSKARAKQRETQNESTPHLINVSENGALKPLDVTRITALVLDACEGLGREVSPEPILQAMQRDLYEGVPMEEVRKSLVLAARGLIEQDPGYSYVTARLLMHALRMETLGVEAAQSEMNVRYAEYLPEFVKKGIEAELIDERLAQYDLKCLGAALDANRDLKFTYLGLQILYDRYFLHIRDRRIELPQIFFMRVAMGLALNEPENQREARAIEFYNVLSSFDFMSSTPTLFNSGTRRSQLASCYLTTVSDDLDGIYEAIKENAMLQKSVAEWTHPATGCRICLSKPAPGSR